MFEGGHLNMEVTSDAVAPSQLHALCDVYDTHAICFLTS